MKRKDTDLKSRFALTNYCFLIGLQETAEEYNAVSPEPVALGPGGLWVSDNTLRFFEDMKEWVEENFSSRKKMNQVFLDLWERMARFARLDFQDYSDFLERYSGHEKSVARMHVLDWSAMKVAEEKDYFGLDQASFLLASNPPVTLTSQERARIWLAVRKGWSCEQLGRAFGWMRRSLLAEDIVKAGEAVKSLAADWRQVRDNALKNQQFLDSLPLSRREKDFLANLQLLRYLDSGYHKHALTGRCGAKRVLQEVGDRLGLKREDVVNLLPDEVAREKIPEDIESRRKGEYVVYKPGRGNTVSVISRGSKEWEKFSRPE